MKDFTLDTIKDLIQQSLKEEPTGDDWLDSRYNEQVHFIGHTNPYYRLFYLIAKRLQPDFVVELGSWQATASAHFAVGSPHGQVVTIDIHREDKAAQQRTIEATHYCPNLTYINAWTWDCAEQVMLYGSGKKIDILFIDAWHEHQYAQREREIYFPLLADTALVICDDLMENGGIFPGMTRFWEEMECEKFIDGAVHAGIPMGFMKYERNKVATNRAIDTQGKTPDTRPLVTGTKRGRKPRTA